MNVALTRSGSSLLVVLDHLLAALEQTRAPGSHQADLHARGRAAVRRRRVAHVLVVAATVRVLHRVHRHTTDLGPAVALDAELVEVGAGLEHGLVEAAAAGHHAEHAPRRRRDRAARARREPDARALAVLRVAHDDARRAGRLGELRAVAELLLDARHDGTLRELADRADVAHVELRGLAAVDELARAHALDGDEELLVLAEAVLVAELHLGERRAAARIVDDVLDEALDVALALGVVEGPELRGALALHRVRPEDGGLTLTLRADHTTHGGVEPVS